jgi:hypothetical protein
MAGQVIKIDPTQKTPVAPNPAPNPANPPAVDVQLTTIPAAGTVLTFEVVVTDNLGQQANATAQVTIQGSPTVTINPRTQTAGANSTIELTAQASAPGGTISNYTWTLTNVTPPGPKG